MLLAVPLLKACFKADVLFLSIQFLLKLYFIFLTLAQLLRKSAIFCLHILMVIYRMKLQKVVSGLHAPFGGKTIWCNSYGIVLIRQVIWSFSLKIE
jgi:hypothetical protein